MNNKYFIFLLSILSLSFVKADAITDTNAKIMGTFSGVNGGVIINVLGWIVVAVLVIGGCYWYFGIHTRDKKIFTIRYTRFVSNGLYWKPSYRDVGKTVKIGSGGFEIIYLKKAKTWKIGYGGDQDNDMYFYKMPDGYEYNARQKAGVNFINQSGGLVPIVTTNPLMRGQYTALEKQIDALTKNKTNWFDKYGGWILSIAFILIAGVLMWLMFKEFSTGMGNFNGIVDSLAKLVDKINVMQSNGQVTTGGSGLVAVK